jgi:hypothetical protein
MGVLYYQFIRFHHRQDPSNSIVDVGINSKWEQQQENNKSIFRMRRHHPLIIYRRPLLLTATNQQTGYTRQNLNRKTRKYCVHNE